MCGLPMRAVAKRCCHVTVHAARQCIASWNSLELRCSVSLFYECVNPKEFALWASICASKYFSINLCACEFLFKQKIAALNTIETGAKAKTMPFFSQFIRHFLASVMCHIAFVGI